MTVSGLSRTGVPVAGSLFVSPHNHGATANWVVMPASRCPDKLQIKVYVPGLILTACDSVSWGRINSIVSLTPSMTQLCSRFPAFVTTNVTSLAVAAFCCASILHSHWLILTRGAGCAQAEINWATMPIAQLFVHLNNVRCRIWASLDLLEFW